MRSRIKQYTFKIGSCPDCPFSNWYQHRFEGTDDPLECTKMDRDTTVEIPDWCPLDDWGDIKACIKLLGQK